MFYDWAYKSFRRCVCVCRRTWCSMIGPTSRKNSLTVGGDPVPDTNSGLLSQGLDGDLRGQGQGLGPKAEAMKLDSSLRPGAGSISTLLA